MPERDEEFQKRKRRRLADWKGMITSGVPFVNDPCGTGTPEENLSALEDLRKMVYPDCQTGSMNKTVVRIVVA